MKISVNNIRVYAHHGCWKEEERIGGEYIVDVLLDVDFLDAAINDDLSKTVDYVRVSEIVQHEMAIRAKLIENVCHRIHSAMKKEFQSATKIFVRVTKISAPIPGQVESVSVEIDT
jgi:dihydroneopterin aldolase